MQKVVPPRLLVPYLSGRRTIISGYVYRVQDCDRLTTPAALVEALDLCFDGSELTPDVPELYIMRWDARDIDTYVVPYGPHMGGDWSDAPPSPGTGSPPRASRWCRSSTRCPCRSPRVRRSSTSPRPESVPSPGTTA
ncbi:hypothetical protein GCM10027612_64600 [Microbispora bryophytorum subsp. camponoti]